MKSEATFCLGGTPWGEREQQNQMGISPRQTSAALAVSGGSGEVILTGHRFSLRLPVGFALSDREGSSNPAPREPWRVPSPGTAGLGHGSVLWLWAFETTGIFLARLYALHQNINFIISGMKIKSGQVGNINRFYKTL